MFVNDNIVIYINSKKDKSTSKRSRDATKWILEGPRLGGSFYFRILNIFFVKWDRNFVEARFIFWNFRIMKFRKSRFHCSGIIDHRLNYHDQKIRQALHMTYGTIGQLFRPYVSSVVYTVISPTCDRTSDHRMQSRNSTTVLIVHKRCQII